MPCRTCQKRTTRWAVAAVSRSKFSNAASIVWLEGLGPGRALITSRTVGQPKPAARARISTGSARSPFISRSTTSTGTAHNVASAAMVSSYLPALGVFGDVGLGQLAFLVQRAHGGERRGVIARRGLGGDLVGDFRQHAADFGLRLGLGLRQQPLLHHVARLHQKLAEQARRNIGAQADFFRQHTVLLGAL